MKKINDIPYKERQRHFDFQFNQTTKQEELAIQKENKRLKKLKEEALKGGEG